MARSNEATKFFTMFLQSLSFYLVTRLFAVPFSGLPLSSSLGLMIKYLLTSVIISLYVKPLVYEIIRALKLGLGVRKRPPSYTDCCAVANIVKIGIYDNLFKVDNIFSLEMVSLVSVCMLCVVSLGWDRDLSGFTEGVLISSGKWFIISCMAMKSEESTLCAIVLAFSIMSLLTSVGEPLRDRTDDSPPLKENVYFTGEHHEVRRRSALVLKLFWLCSLLIRITGAAVTIWIAYKFFLGYTTSSAILILGIISSLAIYVGGISMFKKLLTEFVKHQQGREERRWFVGIGIMGLCEAFIDENTILPFIIISAISIFTVCVITSGWDYDRSGVSEGLAMTYALWMVLFLVNSKSALQLVICGFTFSFLIASKLSEPLLEKQS